MVNNTKNNSPSGSMVMEAPPTVGIFTFSTAFTSFIEVIITSHSPFTKKNANATLFRKSFKLSATASIVHHFAVITIYWYD
jgi:hypothetical protein